jgi:nucleotide-binding universal stress UspA family protein
MDRSREAAAEALKGEVGSADVRTVAVTGHSARSILDYAEAHDVDCIVIASHRPGLQDFFLGSTAARVVRHATCAVHVVR